MEKSCLYHQIQDLLANEKQFTTSIAIETLLIEVNTCRTFTVDGPFVETKEYLGGSPSHTD